MKKIKVIILSFLILSLVSCTTINEDDLSIVLNPGIDTVEINSSYDDPGATAKAYGFTVENEVIFNDFDITTIGNYTITYQVDYKNVTKTISRIVTVIDETPPTGVLNAGVDTIFVGDSWIDTSCIASDNSLDEVIITVSGYVNVNIAGEYIITYILTDSSSNTTELSRHVFVINKE